MAVVVCMIRAYYIRVCACNQSKILDVRCHRSIGLASSFHGRLRPPTIILNCIPLSLSLFLLTKVCFHDTSAFIILKSESE